MKIPFEELVKLHNTVELVANSYWREHYKSEVCVLRGVVFGYVTELSDKGWEWLDVLYKDVKDVSPLTMHNPTNLPIL